MKIDCIADLHGSYPKLEGGDLLIVAGDLTAMDTREEYVKFFYWLDEQEYKEIVLIAGNHDNLIQEQQEVFKELPSVGIKYLQDSGTEFEGLKIWGSPWTLTFPGMNPHCKAFTVDTDLELLEKWNLIPTDTDILITHIPPYWILDRVNTWEHAGSNALAYRCGEIKPRLHVFGHIHEQGGRQVNLMNTRFINASIVDELYNPRHKPVMVEL